MHAMLTSVEEEIFLWLVPLEALCVVWCSVRACVYVCARAHQVVVNSVTIAS